jgi:hypothetical protein
MTAIEPGEIETVPGTFRRSTVRDRDGNQFSLGEDLSARS